MRRLTVPLLVVFFAVPLLAQRVAIIPKVSTLGVGADLALSLSRSFTLRGGYSGGTLTGEPVETDVSYEADLNLSVGNLMLDFSPGGRSFHLTAGILANQSDAEARSTEESVVIVNGVPYRVADVGTLVGDATFEKYAPYIGIGLGNPFERDSRWSFHLDVGVARVGEPEIDLRAEPNDPNQPLPPGFEANLEAEEEDLREEVSGYEHVPVVSFGVGYRF